MKYVGLVTLSAAVLLFQLTLTRIYSVSQGYHFAFLAVSLGLLGFGASGTALFVASGLVKRLRERLLAWGALLFVLTTLGSFWLINVVPFDAYRLTVDRIMLLNMAVFYLAQVVPFFFAGLTIGGAITLDPSRSGSLYGSGLVGSGFGSLLALGGPAALGPAYALGLVLTLGTVAWAAFALERRSMRVNQIVALGVLALLVVGWLAPHTIDTRMSPYKTLAQVLRQQGSDHVLTEWNAFSRVDVVDSDAFHQAPGLSVTYGESLPHQTVLTIDGDRLTTLTASAAAEATFTEFLPTAVAYSLVDNPRVLVVEPGGGLDVLTALHHGASGVTALLGNPLEAGLLEGRLDTASGQVFSDARVDVVAENPRGYLARQDDEFDVIVLSLRDAFRPITSGAYSLQESHEYTLEAFGEYLEHLAPGGVLMATRWVQTPPSEELRVAATVLQALEQRGADPLADKIAAVRTLQTLTVLAKPDGLSTEEADSVRDFVRTRRMDVSYLPGLQIEETNRVFILPKEHYYDGFLRLMDPDARDEFLEEQRFEVAPATDGKPFFFHFFRWSQVPDVLSNLGTQWQPFGGAGFLVVIGFLIVSAVISGVLILVPLVIARSAPEDEGTPQDRTGGLAALAYFFTLGLAFLWIELPLMQRFILLLAHPVYSFGVVLFAILVFSGLGSILSPRLGRNRRWAILALAVLAIVYAAISGPLVEAMLGLPLAVRMVLAVVAIAPLALLMGVPFPSGILALERRQPRLIPWAWGANGYASVLASGLAALMALSWGFSWVLVASGAGYLVAWAVFQFSLDGPSERLRI